MNRRKIVLGLAVVYLFATVCLLFVDTYWGMIFATIFIVTFSCVMMFCLLNVAIKHTNWWKNQFVYTHQFVSNAGYRNYLIRNLEIVNVGSNQARFGFFYENLLGENWSSGTQGLNMDFEILKYRFSFIKEGGIVLLPLALFSSVSEYLNTKKGWRNAPYYVKYFNVLDSFQLMSLPNYRELSFYYRFPLAYSPKGLRYLFIDVPQDSRLSQSEQSLQYTELEKNAAEIIAGWKTEFDIKNLEGPLSDMLKQGMKDSADIMKEMIDFLVERKLKPVILYLPMSEALEKRISDKVKQNYVYDFINMINRPQINFLDYSKEKTFHDNSLYMNSLFFNLNGRKLFTKKVLKDLGIDYRMQE